VNGWQTMPFIWQGLLPTGLPNTENIVAAAMILKKNVPLGGFASRISIFYCPKGPLFDWGDDVLRGRILVDLENFTRKQGGIFLKMDPDVILGTGVPGTPEAADDEVGSIVLMELGRRGWRFSPAQVQFRNTVLLDLSSSEDDILARMKQKSRYNIRLADKKGVVIRKGIVEDLPMLFRIFAETSVRDGFVIRSQDYYLTVWSAFMNTPASEYAPSAIPLIAEVDGEPVAAIFVYHFAGRSYYLYGMSRDAHREKMPNHLLQWEAIRYARAAGCRFYDLWGAPDSFNESDSMWGVYKFKESLGGKVTRTLGAWDFAPHPGWYKLYTEIMPRVLDVMRDRGKKNTIQQLEV
jgi:lipid II:glycine glycyltransferase (peptidoglycan interpeptide bridge formation enzyme)